MVENNAKWKLLFDAKEPDNLPFHEPWYSCLNRFHKLVVCAVLRVDKLPELVESFVSDHIGYKFVGKSLLRISGFVLDEKFQRTNASKFAIFYII